MEIVLLVTLACYLGVLISFHATVRKHPYIAYGTAGFMIGCIFIPLQMAAILYIGSALWAAYDVRKLQVYKYELGGVTNSITTFLGCFFLWALLFPWHLVNRCRIKDGTARLRKKYRKQVRPQTSDDESKAIPPKPRTNETDASERELNKVVYVDVEVEAIHSQQGPRSIPAVQADSRGEQTTQRNREDSDMGTPKDATRRTGWYVVGVVLVIIGLYMTINPPDLVKRENPIVVQVRNSNVGMGGVAILTNRGNKVLPRVTVKVYSRDYMENMTLEEDNWQPNESRELGWIEGWVIESGESMTILIRGYKDKSVRF